MDLISILLIVGIAHGFFTLSLILLRSKKENSGATILLIILLFLIWLQAEFLSIRWPYDIGVAIFYGTRYGSWLLLGPLFLFYANSIRGKKITPVQFIHFIPFVIATLIIPILFSVKLSISQVNYGMLNVFNKYGFEYSPIQWFYSGIFVFQYVHFIIYILVALRIIGSEEDSLKNSFSGDPVLTIQWLKQFGKYLIVAMVSVVVFLAILFFTKIYRRQMDYIYVLPIAFLMYVISFKLSSVKWPAKDKGKDFKKYEKSPLTLEQINILQQNLEDYIVTKKPYLNNGLKLSDLSDSLGIPYHHLSRVINESLGKSFFDYINEKRIEEAKSLIVNNENMTLLEIAFKSGFNNKNSFTNAFKKNVGITPSSFKQKFHLSKN